MIKLAFDASCLVSGNKSGVAHYTQGLIEALAKQYPDDVELVGHYCNFLGRHKPDLPPAPNIRYRQTRLLPTRALNLIRRLRLPVPFELLVKERADFHLFPAFIGWPSLLGTPSLPVIHDVTYLEYPDLMSPRALRDFQRFVPAAIRRAACVIAVSQTTADALKAHYGLAEDKLLVTHMAPVNAIKLSKPAVAEHLKELGVKQPYVLFLGNLEPRKNIGALLGAFRGPAGAPLQKYDLVLAGGEGWQDSQLLEQIEAVKAEGHNVVLTGYVSDEQRAALFAGAAAFVLPSLYEGFGLTILEAMVYDTPVIASDIPIFHEVADEAALFFDPHKPEELAAKLDSLLTDDGLRKDLVAKGRANLRRFSWPGVAKTVYNRLNHG